MSRSVLFNERSLGDLLFQYERQLPKEIRELEGHQVLSTSFSELCTYFENRFRLDIPVLRLDLAHAGPPQDTKIPLSPHESMFFYDGEVREVQGTLFSLIVPFEGDPDLFKFQPNRYYMNHLEGTLTSDRSALLIAHRQRDLNAEIAKAEFDSRLKQIQEYLQTQRSQVADWNAKLADRIKGLLEARKKSALSAVQVAESLGYPLKRREDSTYSLPVTRKRVAVQMPAASAVPYIPEPELAMQQYEDILEIVSRLAVMMERSPSAFSTMSEEHLRDHVLVILNTHFEGQATGETFNKGGKTDILIREKDRNVFIAECKFWDGPKTLTAAIDQLLSYACWRDTKLAVLLFNRRKDFSSVLAAIPDAVTAHSQCRRRLEYKAESGFRFVFKKKDDPKSDLMLTVLGFDVPTAESGDTPPPAIAVPPERPRRKKPSR